LTSAHRVIAVDWPGHGRSSGDRIPASAERYAELLHDLLDALGVERAVIAGNSIGGAAALRYAHRRPDRVRGLVLENPGGLAPVDDRIARAALAGMARFFAAGTRRAWWFPAAYGLYYRFCVLKTGAARDDRRRIVAKAYASAPILLEAWRSFATPAADLRALAPEIRCPVLFAWAKGDQFVQLKRSLPAIRRFPHARVETFRAGHAAHLEVPGAFVAALERFLGALPA
jgi:4,5:9,10-diseco-3-hydroxy-5,9,17-trioxoandrosta-1(10),2-diene-4-oate hydrolase